MKVKDGSFLNVDWDAIQFDGSNVLDIRAFIWRTDGWTCELNDDTLTLRKEYQEGQANRTWHLVRGDWVVVSPFDTLHVIDEADFGRYF